MKTPFSEEQRAAILEHLEILRSTKEFPKEARKYRILEYLVTAEIDGKGDRLKAYAIGVDVLDRRVDFDPSEDSIVRVEMARLRTALSIFYHTHQAALRIEIPKGTYRPEFHENSSLDEAAKTGEGGRLRRLCMRAYLICSAIMIVGVIAFVVSHLRTMDPQRIFSDRPVMRVSGEFSSEEMSHVLETLSGFKNIYTVLDKYSSDTADYRLVFLAAENSTSVQGKVIHSSSGQVVSSAAFGSNEQSNAGNLENWLSSVAQMNGLIE